MIADEMKGRVAVLEQVIKQMLEPLKNIPLYLVIESICGMKVLIYDGTEKDRLIRAARIAAASMNNEGVKSGRVNEVGNKIEPFILGALSSAGFNAGKPKLESGKVKSAGYPDVFATYPQSGSKSTCHFYIECKSYNRDNVATTQRSFYLSPSKDFKVTTDAYHLIFAYSMKHQGNGIYATDGFRILDIRDLLCDVKYEFQSDNKRLYSRDQGSRLIHEEAVLPQ